MLTIFSFLEEREDRRAETFEEATAYGETLAAALNVFAQDLDSLMLAAALALGNQEGPITPEQNQP